MQNKKTRKWILIASVVLIFAAIGGLAKVIDPEYFKERERKEIAEKEFRKLSSLKFSAYKAAQEYVKNKLAAPLTADFSSYDESKCIVTNDKYTYRGSVVSKNSFNVPFKSEFIIELRLTQDNKWELVSMAMS